MAVDVYTPGLYGSRHSGMLNILLETTLPLSSDVK